MFGEHGGYMTLTHGGQVGGLSCLNSVKKKISEKLWLQIVSTTSNMKSDNISCIAVLPSGDFVIAGYSQSTAIDGKTNPYPSTSGAAFIAIIDKKLPPTGFVKDIAWEVTGWSYGLMGRANEFYNNYQGGPYGFVGGLIHVDFAGDIYYGYGNPLGNDANVVIKKRSGANLSSVLATSAKCPTIYGEMRGLQTYGGYMYATHCHWGSYGAYVRKMAISDLSLIAARDALNGIAGTTETELYDALVSSDGIFCITRRIGGGTEYRISKVALDCSSNSSALTGSIVGAQGDHTFACQDADSVYFLQGVRATNKVYAYAYNKSNLSAKSGFSGGEKVSGGANYLRVTGAMIDGGVLYGIIKYATGVANEYRVDIVAISTADGSLLSRTPITYSDGANICEAGKSVDSFASPVSVENSKFCFGGAYNGSLRGFVGSGWRDPFIARVSLKGLFG